MSDESPADVDDDPFVPLDEEPVVPDPKPRKVKVAPILAAPEPEPPARLGDGFPAGRYPETGSWGSKPS
jgi:hypothetical protein